MPHKKISFFSWDIYKVVNTPGELSFEGVIIKNSKDRRLNPAIPQYWPGRTHSVFAPSIEIIHDENHLMSACGGNFCDVEISSAKRSWRHHIILIKIINPKRRQDYVAVSQMWNTSLEILQHWANKPAWQCGVKGQWFKDNFKHLLCFLAVKIFPFPKLKI